MPRNLFAPYKLRCFGCALPRPIVLFRQQLREGQITVQPFCILCAGPEFSGSNLTTWQESKFICEHAFASAAAQQEEATQ